MGTKGSATFRYDMVEVEKAFIHDMKTWNKVIKGATEFFVLKNDYKLNILGKWLIQMRLYIH